MPTALFPLVVQYLHPNSLFSDSFILQLLQDMVFRWIYTPKHDISCTFSAGNSMESWPVLRHPGAPANLTHQILHSPDLGNRFQAGHKPKTSHPECRTIVVRSEMKVLAISNCDIFFWVPCFETNPFDLFLDRWSPSKTPAVFASVACCMRKARQGDNIFWLKMGQLGQEYVTWVWLQWEIKLHNFSNCLFKWGSNRFKTYDSDHYPDGYW